MAKTTDTLVRIRSSLKDVIDINAKNPKFVAILIAAFLLASSVSYAALGAGQDTKQNGKISPEYLRTGNAQAAASDIVPGKYIVELSQKPLVARAKEAKEQLAKGPSLSVAASVAQQKSAIEAEHQSVKNAIAGVTRNLGIASPSGLESSEATNKPVISAEYENVFNGMTVSNINEKQVQQIKSISGVRNVYPVQKVHALLSDSVPLIGADQAWKLDKDGGQCASSGKDCLTGKGVKIAVIDTGVDYTHPDLGKTKIKDDKFEKINDKPLEGSFLNDQSIVLDGNRVFYPSKGRIFIHYFDTNKTTEVRLYGNIQFVYEMAVKDNLLVYFGADELLDEAGFFLYDITKNESRKLFDANNIGTFQIESNKLIYGMENSPFDKNSSADKGIYTFDLTTNDTTKIASSKYLQMQAASNGRIAYALPDSVAYEKAVVYDIASNTSKDYYPPNIGGIVDMEGDMFMYFECNKTGAGCISSVFYIYNFTSNKSVRFSSQSNVSESKPSAEQIRDFNGYVSFTSRGSRGRIGKDVAFFVPDRYEMNLFAHDLTLNRSFWINNRKPLQGMDAQGKKACIIGRDNQVYCHDFDPAINYFTKADIFNQKVIGGYDFINDDDDPMDDMGHGTHVAATAAGNGALKGVAPDAKILAYKVLDSSGSGNSDTIIAGIERAVDPNKDGDFSDRADVISMSLGGPGDPDDPMSKAIDNAADAGVVAVIAGGNWGPGLHTIASPGTARKAITVAASDKKDAIADFSSRGPVIWTDKNGNIKFLYKPDITAPGVAICAAQSSQDQIWAAYKSNGIDVHCKDDKHISISGTSMATPHVAGLAALLKQKYPDASPEKIKLMITGSAKNISDNNLASGYGRINATGAVSPAFASPDNITSIETPETNGNYYSIKGRINTQGFEKYKIDIAHLSPESGAVNFKEIGSSSSLPTDGYLGKNIPLPDDYGLHLLKLIVTAGKKQTERFAFLFNRKGKFISLMDGWPQKAVDFQAGFFGVGTTPVIYDLDNDGKQEIIATANDLVTVFSSDGTVMKGWPKKLDDGTMSSGSIPPPSVGDINGDGKPEIVYFDYWSFFLKNGKACGYAWEPDGSNAPGWENDCKRPDKNNYENYTRAFSMIYDIDGDGKGEIINWVDQSWTENQKFFINVIRGDGSMAEGWPVVFDKMPDNNTHRDIIFPAAGDIDGDGIPELVILENDYDNDLKSFACSTLIYTPKGALKKKFSSECSYGYYEGIILLDVDNDGKLDIGYHTKDGKIVFYDANGNVVKNWPFDNYNYQKYLLSVADLAGDGTPDIIFPVWERKDLPRLDGVNAIDSSAKQLPGWPKKTIGFPLWVAAQAADINDDNKPDVITTTSAGLVYAWNGNGTAINGFPIEMFGFSESGTAVGDIDNDGQNEIAASTTDGTIYVWKLGSKSGKSEWPMWKHDAQNTALYSLGSSTGSSTYTLSLKKGWNLFSVPVKENQPTQFVSFETNCKYKSPLWKYSNAKNSYEKATTVTSSKESFWIKAGSDCTVAVKNNGAYEMDEYFKNFALKKGWNFIGGAPEITFFDDIKGTCIFAKGPYWFNTAANSWVKTDQMEPGKGYVIAVQNECRLEQEGPPSFPEAPSPAATATGRATEGAVEEAMSPIKLPDVTSMAAKWIGQGWSFN